MPPLPAACATAWACHRCSRVPRWWPVTVRSGRAPPADHAMVCTARTKGVTMRHDLLLEACRRIAQRAGVAATVEPAMERLQAGTGRASLERSDMLVVLPDEGLVVTDVSVVHPAANSFFQRAAHTAGTAASTRDAPKSCKYGGGGQVAGSSFTPLLHGVLWAPGSAGDAASVNPSHCFCLLCDCWVGCPREHK
jgi:hypothetical protein